jgi:hypothetical protein
MMLRESQPLTLIQVEAPGIVVRVAVDGSFFCRNGTDRPVDLIWLGQKVTVRPRTEFSGTPAIQRHAMLDMITYEAVEAALSAA